MGEDREIGEEREMQMMQEMDMIDDDALDAPRAHVCIT